MEPSLPRPTGGFATRAITGAVTLPAVRLSVGLEDVEDLLADVHRGLAAADAAREGMA